MDTEQLKLIINMMNGAGAGAKEIAILYMALALAKSMLTAGGFITCFILIGRTVLRCITHTSSSAVAWKAVCEAAGLYPTFFPEPKDINQVIAKLKK